MYTIQAEKVGIWCMVLFRGIDRWFRQLEIQRKCAEFGRLMDVDKKAPLEINHRRDTVSAKSFCLSKLGLMCSEYLEAGSMVCEAQ